jgi:hypothetical protein
MKIEKLSLKSVKNVLSRAELKKIMAGSGPVCTLEYEACGYGAPPPPACCAGLICTDFKWAGDTFAGTCLPG